jgi:two-component system, chemotaxis family, chemotaxis protein CheY
MTVAKKPQVMIAEDEEHSRVLLKAILHSMNCEVVGEAKNGVEAVQLYKQLKPHLLLLDINMPLKTGEEVLQEIRSDFPNAFVIMVTSVSDLASIEQCLNLGAANFIRKDTPIDEIKTILKESWQTFLQHKLP